MNILIIGSGGREHALAWKVSQSPRLSQLFVIPGNAGTAPFNNQLLITDHSTIATFSKEHQIDLVLIGPEVPLADGLADSLRAAGVKVFGPSRAAAEIESSKAFAKAFMAHHNLPSARYATFSDYEEALDYIHTIEYPIVIKASGLAAGKGVILPNSLAETEQAIRSIMLEHEFGSAGDEVIIEERLSGEEVSLLCFTDGLTVKAMPPAQDHKRLLDGDLGPNTGGMGAYAPTPVCPPALAEELTRTILQPAIDGLRSEGRPFVGVLYAGLMLTPDGPRLLEFNCRFGDPETQVVLPLLDSDLLDIAEACADGRLAEVEVKWKSGTAACVVLASEGYPGQYPSGREIKGLDQEFDRAVAFHAGTQVVNGKTVTAGGRVLSVTGWGESLESALSRAYQSIEKISFEGMRFRKDIGRRALLSTDKPTDKQIETDGF
jgi:phosphoribosylamine--glycine ligase